MNKIILKTKNLKINQILYLKKGNIQFYKSLTQLMKQINILFILLLINIIKTGHLLMI